MRVKRAVVVYRKTVPLDRPLGLLKGQQQALATVKKELGRHGIRFTLVERERFRDPGTADLVITVGGDGTFLTASHCINETPVMGVNATPQHSVAFFSATTAANFANHLMRLLAGKLKCLKIFRLEARINGRRIREPILNEVLCCHPSPAGTARYQIMIGNQAEEQRSSGVLVGAAAGSAALIHSAGGLYLPLLSDRIQLVIREPYEPKGKKCRIKKKLLPPRASVKIVSKMARGLIFIDGSHISYPVRFGDKIEVRRSPHPLYIISPARAGLR